MYCYDTTTYQWLVEQRNAALKAKQLHQHKIWQHVQDRLAEQNEIIEEEVLEMAGAQGISGSDTTDNDEDTTLPDSSQLTPRKRTIRWGLQNNTTKRFEKTSPITLVTIPAFDKRPIKGVLKIRTESTIQSQDTLPIKASTTRRAASTTLTTTTTTTMKATTQTTKSTTMSPKAKKALERMTAKDFF
ncbi:hypothetical protein BGX31_000814 [Mortierella sp. GBA43]|nr:hypothetical protein BGX31_000814 [Mortierella sp. GBA43]